MKRTVCLLVFLLPILVLAGASGAGAQPSSSASTTLSTSASTGLSTSASTGLSTGASTTLSTSHDLSWHVVAAGGAPMAAAGHRVNGTLSQPAIGPAAGPVHTVGLGYCYGFRRAAVGYKIYLPLVVRGE